MDAYGKVIILEKGLQLRVKLQPKSKDAVPFSALPTTPLYGESRKLFSPPEFPTNLSRESI